MFYYGNYLQGFNIEGLKLLAKFDFCYIQFGASFRI